MAVLEATRTRNQLGLVVVGSGNPIVAGWEI